jgi:sterol desaturase/sphingolipid hydroxylase (fatty acid hydroxylase superfamily)
MDLPADLILLPVRTFWSGNAEVDLRYLATSSLIVAVLVGDGHVRTGLVRVWRSLDLARVMRTRSAWMDVLIFVLSAGLFSAVFAAVREAMPSATGAGRTATSALVFWTDEPVLGAAAAGVVLTLLAFVLADLSFYATHRLMHAVPFLWAFHKVHHSATELYPLTTYRTHPVQVVVAAAAFGLTTTFAAGVALGLGGSGVTTMRFLGANAAGGLLLLFGAIYRHSRVWVTFPGRLRHVVHSPAHHQIHHSADPADFNANYSGFLLIWDRLFRTYRDPAGRNAPTRIGIDDARVERIHANPVGVFVYPFVDAIKSLTHKRESARIEETSYGT